MQASELQEINKLIKEAERLCAMAVGDAEDCGSEDNSCLLVLPGVQQ